MKADLDDCFRASSKRMTVADALGRFQRELSPVAGEIEVDLRRALGRVCAEDVVAEAPIPPHDNAAVDGFAVFFDDLESEGETRLKVTGRIAAGHPLGRDARRGEALQIFTGAPMPDGPDTVFMVEDCALDGDAVVLPAGIERGANRRRAGEDVEAGRAVLKRGVRLRPQEVGMAASVGRATLKVYAPLRVAVFSTGDEIRDPGGALEAGCIYDVNRFAVMALLDALGCDVTDCGIFPDRLDDLARALEKAAAVHDVVITSGGVSMGEEDHVRVAVEKLGSLNFWNLAIKPGRPIALGTIGAGEARAVFIGLPGNPVAAMVTFLRIARPILLRLGGAAEVAPASYPVEAGFDFAKKAGRREFLRARLEIGTDGRRIAHKFPADGSGILTSMVEADGLVELEEARGPVKSGETVDFLPFNEVLR